MDKYQYQFRYNSNDKKYLTDIKKQALCKLIKEIPIEKLDKIFNIEEEVEPVEFTDNQKINRITYKIVL